MRRDNAVYFFIKKRQVERLGRNTHVLLLLCFLFYALLGFENPENTVPVAIVESSRRPSRILLLRASTCCKSESNFNLAVCDEGEERSDELKVVSYVDSPIAVATLKHSPSLPPFQASCPRQ
jgi:hypothetical protein